LCHNKRIQPGGNMLVPSGTVTFLFTDIEGSTRLAREHADRWESLRSRHHEILRGAIEQNHGFVFQIIGDAFCASFHRPADALNAAVRAQQQLESESWGDTVIRVRMGIHTGEAESVGQDYRGYLTMSLVQRLMSAGHGGQILVSGAAENLLHGQSLGEIYLQDLGWHYFKDVPQPVRLFQVTASGLQMEFPPVRTIDHHPNNLPSQLTSFVGREKERTEIRRLLQNTHMLTLIGPGGTGKTRLSIQAAKEMLDAYPDGVWLVELAPILDPLLVPRTTAMTIGLRDEPQRPVIDMLCDYLHERKMLILLDNCEHLVDACARMADRILHAAPGVVILASSREALGIGGEVTYRVPSLGLPDLANLPSVETLDQYEAVRLFIDRATSADPTFAVTNQNAPSVAQICHRLDGIPLAIELAAAKIRVLGVDQIARRLDDRFKLLTGGSRTALERHQTLRAAIDWSFNLLPPAEQILFRRLSVFVDGWTLEAAETVCSGETVTGDAFLDLLEHLIHKSLVFREEARYRMLETIRQYASEKLVESGESNVLRDRHLEYYLELAESAEPHLIRAEQLEWLEKIDADYENLRLALEWTFGKEEGEMALRLCTALGSYWYLHGYWMEGTRTLSKALAMKEQASNNRERIARVRVYYWDAFLADQLDDLDRLEHSAMASLSLAEHVSNGLDLAIAKYLVSQSIMRRNSLGEARILMEQSIADFEKLNEPFWEATAFHWLHEMLFLLGELYEIEIMNRFLELAQRAGERTLLADALEVKAFWFYTRGQTEEAGRIIQQSVHLYEQVKSGIRSASTLPARIAWVNGDRQSARSLLLEKQQQLQVLGEKNNRAVITQFLGQLEMEMGNLDQAEFYLRDALGLFHEVGNPGHIVSCKTQLAILAYFQGNVLQSRRALKDCISLVRDWVHLEKVAFLGDILAYPPFQIPENSVQILGALNNFFQQMNRPMGPLRERYYDSAAAKARVAMGDIRFDSACADGAKLSIDEALDLVLRIVEKV
jgi:predicted ATPase/class 3 adenylate cyclase